MPLIEYIAPRSEKRLLLICANSDSVSAIAKNLHAMNPICFGLYIYHGSDPSQELLLHTIRRQYAHIIQINITREIDYSVYVETPTLDSPLVQSLAGDPRIRVRHSDSLHIQINVSIANMDQIYRWFVPLLNHGAARL